MTQHTRGRTCSDLRRAPCSALLLSLLAAGAAAGCAQKSSECACPPVHEAGKAETRAFLSKNRDHYERSIRRARARAWLDDLTVDPASVAFDFPEQPRAGDET